MYNVDVDKNHLNAELDKLSKDIVWNRKIRENLEQLLISIIAREKE